MCVVNFQCSHIKKDKVLLIVDGKTLILESNETGSVAKLNLEEGNHTITIIKDYYLFKWYWWLNIFNFIYVFMRFINVVGGDLGYDKDFASYTINFDVKNEYANLSITLIKKLYNDKGFMGEYYSWCHIKHHNIRVKTMNADKMGNELIRKWKITRAVPTPLFCLVCYIYFTIGLFYKTVEFTYLFGAVFFFMAIWTIYVTLSALIKKSVEENMKSK